MKTGWLLVFAATDRKWAYRIAKHLEGSPMFSALPAESPAPEAEGVMFLLSEDFLQESVQRCNTLEQVLSRTINPEIRLFAVLLSPCDWEDSPYAGLPILPPQRIPLGLTRHWSGGEDAAIAALVTAIRSPLTAKNRNRLQLAWAMLPPAKRHLVRWLTAGLVLLFFLLLLYALT